MDSNKKPSEPSEAERWAKMENETQKLKRSRSILCVSSFVQSLLLWRIIGQINQIRELLTLLVRFDALVSQHLQCLSDSLVNLFRDFEMFLSMLTKFF